MTWKRGNRLKLVSEVEAPARTVEIFSEICHALGVPKVPLLYRAYAAVPRFLDLHWQVFRPALESRQFFVLGARLAAESYTRAHNYFLVPRLPGRRPTHSRPSESPAKLPLSQVLDYYQYLDPLMLMVAAAQMQAFEGTIGLEDGLLEPGVHPKFPMAPRLVNDEQAPSTVLRIWDERRRTFDVVFVSDEHRALAAWPGFYQEYWRALKELLRSPLYTDCQFRIGESAGSLARELPVQLETSVLQLFEAGINADEVSSLSRLHESLVKALSGLVLDVTFARIACEGGTRSERDLEPTEIVLDEKIDARTKAA